MSKKHRMFQETPRKGKTTKLADTTPEFPYPELIQAIWAGESNSIIVVDSGSSDNEKVTKYCKQLTCYPDFHKLGYDIYKALNCSSKGISQDVLDDENNHAFILSSQFEKNGDKLNWQKEIDLYRMPEDMSQSDGRE